MSGNYVGHSSHLGWTLSNLLSFLKAVQYAPSSQLCESSPILGWSLVTQLSLSHSASIKKKKHLTHIIICNPNTPPNCILVVFLLWSVMVSLSKLNTCVYCAFPGGVLTFSTDSHHINIQMHKQVRTPMALCSQSYVLINHCESCREHFKPLYCLVFICCKHRNSHSPKDGHSLLLRIWWYIMSYNKRELRLQMELSS